MDETGRPDVAPRLGGASPVDVGAIHPMPAVVHVLQLLSRALQWVCIMGLAGLVAGTAVGVLISEFGVLEWSNEAGRRLDEYLRMYIGVAGLGGLFGCAALLTLLHILETWFTQRRLDKLAAAGGRDVPIAWQLASVAPVPTVAGVLVPIGAGLSGVAGGLRYCWPSSWPVIPPRQSSPRRCSGWASCCSGPAGRGGR